MNLKLNKTFLFLILIILFFLLTRLYKITEIPLSVYWDEASISYNAYSIAQTGKDEWGDFLPIHFRAFGEFKLPVYIYSVVPFIATFGLNEFSVRIPAVLFSLGVVILTYLLAKKLFDNKVGLFAAFFVTISPWFFIFSRTGFEATAGLAFYLLAIYLFLRFSKELGKLRLFHSKNGIFIVLSIISFILSCYSYNSFRIIAPLTILILIFLERDNLKDIVRRQFKWVMLSLAIITISFWPIYRLYVYDVGFFRLQVVGTVTTETFIKNYISHFSLDFLLGGDKNLRHQQRGFGQVYFPELILLLFGFLYIMGSKSKHKLLPILLLLIGPIPASLTRESPHALRAISTAPFIHLISALGVIQLMKYFPKKYLVMPVSITIFLTFFINYFSNFINIYPVQSSKEWQYGYKKIFIDYKDDFQKYDRVIISDQYAQPYIFALFYLKYDSNKFRRELVRNSIDQWGFSTVKKFGKFEYAKINNFEGNLQNTLIFTDQKIQNKIPLDSIKFSDGKIAFWVYQFKN